MEPRTQQSNPPPQNPDPINLPENPPVIVNNFSHKEYIVNDDEYAKIIQDDLAKGLKEIRYIVAGVSRSGKTTFLENLKAVLEEKRFFKGDSSSNIQSHGTQQISQDKLVFLEGINFVYTDIKGFEPVPTNENYIPPEEMASIFHAAFLGIFTPEIARKLPHFDLVHAPTIELPQHACLVLINSNYDQHGIEYMSSFAKALALRDVKFSIVVTKFESTKRSDALRQISLSTGKDIDHVSPCECCTHNYEFPTLSTKYYIRKILLDVVTMSRENPHFKLSVVEREKILSDLDQEVFTRKAKNVASRFVDLVKEYLFVVLVVIIAILATLLLK